MKTFTLTYEEGNETVSCTFRTDYLHVVFQKMELFLKSSGFIFEGNVGIDHSPEIKLPTLADYPHTNPDYLDLSGINYTEPSAFSSMIDDHISMVDKFPNTMTVDLTQTKTGGCANCTCGKKNAN